MKRFYPSNSIDGDYFRFFNCDSCKKDINDDCPIYDNAISGVHVDEWTCGSVTDPKTWKCSAFESIEKE